MHKQRILLIIALILALSACTAAWSSTITAVSAGYGHTVMLRSDGTVWTFGFNYFGQLGDGTNTDRLTPVQVPNLTNITAISAGTYHTVALRSDGTVWTWGYNGYGQLGNGTTIDRNVPAQVTNLTGITSISAGDAHTVALKTNGTVVAWGDNYYGQLGDGTTTQRNVPTPVSNLTGVSAISAGGLHTVALKTDGTVRTWGNNELGQLGDGTTVQRNSPVQVSNLTGVSAISAGYAHTIVTKTNGTTWAWGLNGLGQLGDGTNSDRRTPVQVSGLTGASAISAGGSHSMAMKSDGSVWVWGSNIDGELGNGTYDSRSIPMQLTNFTGASKISAGFSHSVAVKNNNTIWAWGDNFYGQLGDGTTNPSNIPVLVAFDMINPVGTLSINGGAAYTNSTSVTLNISATDNSGVVSQMRISNDGVFDTEPWEAYATSKSWTLTSGDGSKTVYAVFRDAFGNESQVASDTIIIDTTSTSIKTTITPALAASAGAQWRRVGTSQWFDSGATESGLRPGSYEIEFKDIPVWIKPANIIVTCISGQTAQASGAYTRIASVNQSKVCPDGTSVRVNAAIVSAAFNGFFYIESDNRECGIRVEKAGHNLTVGMRADITGTMSTNSQGERSIQATTAVQTLAPNDKGSVRPIGLINKALGGGDCNYQSGTSWPATISGQKGIKDCCGINNIGLLVKVWGRVTDYERVAKPTWFTIDDGSSVGVKCIIPSGVTFDTNSQFVTVTGICSCEKVGSELNRVLLIRPNEMIISN